MMKMKSSLTDDRYFCVANRVDAVLVQVLENHR